MKTTRIGNVSYRVIAGSDPDHILKAAEVLKSAGNPDGLREAKKLWQSTFPRQYVDYSDASDGTALARFDALVKRRAAGEPMSHLLGYRDFYKHRFEVTSAVLDPRPDTETLIDTALEEPFTSVLDLGTGSGCILLSLLAAAPAATGVGTDLSQNALDVALKNVTKFELDTRASLALSDWFVDVTGEFDLIVSNPPYIAADEMDSLQPEVRHYEPRMALTDEADGLTHYRKIIAGYDKHLLRGGRLMVEIGPTQAEDVAAMMQRASLLDVTIKPDIDGRNRVVWGRKPLKSA